MRHDWIFDVLADLRSYAQKNDLPDLARQVDVALRVAREEISAAERGWEGGGGGSEGGMPPTGRPH